jgi:hypothetical protein
MKSRCKEEMKEKVKHFIFGARGGNSITLLEGSQATPARPYDMINVKVKTLW